MVNSAQYIQKHYIYPKLNSFNHYKVINKLWLTVSEFKIIASQGVSITYEMASIGSNSSLFWKVKIVKKYFLLEKEHSHF